MFRPALLVAVTCVVLFPIGMVAGQESDNPPTIGQRLDRFRKNLFGGDKDETIVTAPSARAGGRAPNDGRAPNGGRTPNDGRRRAPASESFTSDDVGPLPERTAGGTTSRDNAARSSRRTFQPGYEPVARRPASEAADDEPQSVARPAMTATTEPQPPKPSTRMPAGYAGPQRTAEATTESVDSFEPTLADRATTSGVGSSRRMADSSETTATRSSSTARIPTRRIDAPSTSDAGEFSSAPATGTAKTVPTKTTPRTLEERLAAARNQQTPKTIRPSTAAPQTSKPVTPRASDIETTPLVTARQDQPEPASASQLPAAVAEELPVDPPVEKVASRPLREPAPVKRVARLNKQPLEVPAESGDSEPMAGSNAAEHVLFKQQSPVLSVETSGPSKIKIGTPATYSVTMQNTGNVAAQEVVVSIKLPEWAEIAAAAPRNGTARTIMIDGGAGLQWTIPTLDAKSRAELNVSIVPRKSRPFELAVSFTRTPEVSQASVEVQEPKLLMNLAGPDEIYFGEREVYKLTLSNPGTGEAENVVVRLLPTSAGDEQAVSHPIGNIGAGESKVVELELTAKQSNTLEIKAEAVADGDLRASIDEVITVRRAELDVAVYGSKLQYAGTPATYRVRVSNPGNAAAKNVQVNALLPRGATYLTSSDGGIVDTDQRKVTWTVGNLRAGTEVTMAFKCLLNAPGSNTAQVACQADGEIRHQGSATTEVEALADLTLKIIDPKGPVPVGQEITYEVHVLNRGTKAAEDVEIMAFFSPGIEPVSVEPGHHQIGAGQIAFTTVPQVQAGQEIVYKIRARADRAANHIFRAEVACPTLETKLSADETTRFYVDNSLEVDAAAAQPAELAPQDEEYEEEVDESAEMETVEEEALLDDQPLADDSEEPQPE